MKSLNPNSLKKESDWPVASLLSVLHPSLSQQGLFRCLNMAAGTVPVDVKVFFREGHTEWQVRWLTCLLLGET